MNTISTDAAAGALQLAMSLQQNLSNDVAAMGGNNPVLASGQKLAAMDAGGAAVGMGGGTSSAVHSLDTYG